MIQRLKQLMQFYKLTTVDLANKLAMSRYTIDKYLQKVNPPSAKFIKLIFDNFPNISREWFLEGEGEMLRASSDVKFYSEVVNSNNNGISPEDLDTLYKELVSHHVSEIRSLHIEIEKQQAIIDRLTDIIAKKSGM